MMRKTSGLSMSLASLVVTEATFADLSDTTCGGPFRRQYETIESWEFA
jgi:hypothetical protein